MRSEAVVFLLFALAMVTVESNSEGDVLFAWKTNLVDLNNVLESWNQTLVNPCTWFHVTCNSDNSVTRVDLGNAGLSGPLVPELGMLTNLQYLEVYANNFSGSIPRQLGNLRNLISLDLYENQLTGSIPPSLGNLRSLTFLRLNSNKLTGNIPAQLLYLIHWGNLRTMNVSDNQLAGTVHHNNKTEELVYSYEFSSPDMNIVFNWMKEKT